MSLPELLWYGEGAILADSSNSSQEEALVLTVESDKEEQGVAGEVDTAAAAESIDPPRAGNPLSARAGATPPAGYCAPVLHCRVLQCYCAPRMLLLSSAGDWCHGGDWWRGNAAQSNGRELLYASRVEWLRKETRENYCRLDSILLEWNPRDGQNIRSAVDVIEM